MIVSNISTSPNLKELYSSYNPVELREHLDALLFDYAAMVLEKEDMTTKKQQDHLYLIKTLRDTLGERSPIKSN